METECDHKLSECTFSSPVGTLELTACKHGLHKLKILKGTRNSKTPTVVLLNEKATTADGKSRLEESIYWFRQYFGKSPDLEKAFGPPVCKSLRADSFQDKVLQVLRQQVTFGNIISYAALAQLAGKDKKSARAVGQAMSANNIPIVFPCHRVVNTNNKIGKFSAGVGVKSWLLQHEGCVVKKGSVFRKK